MDDQRFDALTRTLAAGTSRRTVLKALAGGIGGALGLGGRVRADDESACSPAGGPCSADLPCCDDADLICVNGTCEYDVMCAGLGAACTADRQCCSAYCNLATGQCDTFTPGCVEQGGPCTTPADCCAGLVCNQAAWTCEPPTCASAGERCLDHFDCCGDLICADGVCASAGADEDVDDGADGDTGENVGNGPETGETDSSGSTTRLPRTGQGAAAGSSISRWLAPVALATAAAALVTGRRRAAGRSTADHNDG